MELEVKLEREKVKEEMQRAAEEDKLEQQRQEEERQALQEIHDEHQRLIAAKVLQAQMRCFLARKLLRKKAYLRYKKHFDPATGAFYYEDKRSGRTTWDKPKSLGTYDVSCDASWVAMRDSVRTRTINEAFNLTMLIYLLYSVDVQEGDVYYFHPQTWAMQWTIPRKALMCSECKDQFAVAHLTIDERVYCGTCLSARVGVLLQTMRPTDITYRVVQGGFEGSAETNFSKLKLETWPVHQLQLTMGEDVEVGDETVDS